tara:strand:+ start:2178 stop:2852 length:675 start_codon:yes stop_codon:yes gene_type:complete
MLSRLLFLTTLLFGALLFEGCVTHSPMSEAVIFHSKEKEPFQENSKERGFSGSYSPTKNTVLRLAELEYPRDPLYDTRPANRNGLSAGIYLTKYDSEGRYAISGTTGIAVTGVDATVKIWGRNYFTAGVSVPGHLQLYLQQRTVNNSMLGMTLGLGYQRSIFTFHAGNSFIDEVSLNSYGLRSYLFIKEDENTVGPFRSVGIYIGYAPSIELPVVQISFQGGHF